jgi:uncharacterized membrane protein YoaK (UPF0700 family)
MEAGNGRLISSPKEKGPEYAAQKALRAAHSARLAMVVFKPTKAFEFAFFPKYSFILTYSPFHLSLIAFVIGYIDANSYIRFGFFAAIQTGNLIILINGLNAFTPNVSNGVVPLVMAANVILGPVMSSSLLIYLPQIAHRERAYVLIALYASLACFVVDAIIYWVPSSSNSVYAVILVSIATGCFQHWSSKLGYLTFVHTGNMVQ